jgi:K+-transporting ATPase ATPase C chain
MKSFIKAFRLTLVFCVFLSVTYILVLWLFAKVAGPNDGNAEVATLDGKVVGAANVGQQFTQDIYFWGRPSCAGDGYDAASSGGSNKGPTNPEYLAEVEARIDTFLVHHPYLQRKDVPAEMVTASGSGLDPDITPQCARVQVRRVAAARGMSEQQVADLVEKSIQSPFLGLFGTEKVNVLKLNIALEELDNKKLQ